MHLFPPNLKYKKPSPCSHNLWADINGHGSPTLNTKLLWTIWLWLSLCWAYRSGTVNSNTVNSKFHLIWSYCEIFFYHFPNISCLKCTVNSNFHLIRSKSLLTNDFELTIPDLYFKYKWLLVIFYLHPTARVQQLVYFILIRGGSRIPCRSGRRPSGVAPTYDFVKFSEKLHEIEKVLGHGGGVHTGDAPP